MITNPTVKHNFSQLLARAEGDKQQVRELVGCEGVHTQRGRNVCMYASAQK